MNCFISTDSASSRITLDRKLGAGGEGTVYSITGDTTRCVKIYHDKKRTHELEAKLTAMIAAPPKDPTLAAGHYSICWPQAVVYEDEACTTFIGFIMPLIDTKVFREYHLLCDKPGATSSVCYRLENFGTGFTYLHMYVVALNLASCVASIHEAGHAIGDLNDKNILVSTKDSKITIVDCDSFEIHSPNGHVFPCSVYMPEYSAPEVIKHEKIENRQLSDRFALAVLIFKLLMLNTHPYASRGSSVEHLNTPGEKIADGYYPYEYYDNLEVFPPAYALPYEIIPPNIKELFRRCFKVGQHMPDVRPPASDWFDNIGKEFIEMHLFQKNNNIFCENNQKHIYPCHLTYCPWCTMKDDYFPKYINQKKQKVILQSNDAFSYLLQLLEVFMRDDNLSIFEEKEIIREIEKRNLTQENLLSVYEDFEKKNPTKILGKKTHIISKEIKFPLTYQTDQPKERVLIIQNNYLINDIIVKCDYKSNFIFVEPNEVRIKPEQKAMIVFKLHPYLILPSDPARAKIFTIITEQVKHKVYEHELFISYKIIKEIFIFKLMRHLLENKLLLFIFSIINFLLFMFFCISKLSKDALVTLIVISCITLYGLFIAIIYNENHREVKINYHPKDEEKNKNVSFLPVLFVGSIFLLPLIVKFLVNSSTQISPYFIIYMLYIAVSASLLFVFKRVLPDMRKYIKQFIYLLALYFITSWIMVIFN